MMVGDVKVAPPVQVGGKIGETGCPEIGSSESVDLNNLVSGVKSGEKAIIKLPNGKTIEVEKTAFNAYPMLKGNVIDAFKTVATGGTSLINLSLGTDPVAASGGALYGAFNFFSNMQWLAAPFKLAYAPFEAVAAPILDGIKFMNTVKLARLSPDNPAEKSWKNALTIKNLASIAVDGGHWGLDVATAVALAGAAVGFPPLAAIAPTLLGYSIWGHVASLGFHAAKAGINLSDPINGSTFSERLNKYMNMQSATSLSERVFQGKEPLIEEKQPAKKSPAVKGSEKEEGKAA
jgi:hypothetical protein